MNSETPVYTGWQSGEGGYQKEGSAEGFLNPTIVIHAPAENVQTGGTQNRTDDSKRKGIDWTFIILLVLAAIAVYVVIRYKLWMLVL